MYSPTSRVLTVLEILQARGTVSASELAARLGVDPRTIRRYVTALRDLGIPVESRPGRHGGYHLGPGSKLPPLMFDDGEAVAIVVSLSRALARDAEGSGQSGTATALAKINRVLPRELRAGVRAIQENAEFTAFNLALPHDRPVHTDDATILGVATARDLRQTLSIRYRTWAGDESERRIDPYGLVQHRNIWYVAGWCHLREANSCLPAGQNCRIDRYRWPFRHPGRIRCACCSGPRDREHALGLAGRGHRRRADRRASEACAGDARLPRRFSGWCPDSGEHQRPRTCRPVDRQSRFPFPHRRSR